MSSKIIAGGATTSPTRPEARTRPELRRLARQVSRFLVIGGCSAATDFACYLLLLVTCGLPSAPAKGISYAAGMVIGFFGNKFWTFESPGRSLSEPMLYTAWYAFTLIINMATNGLVLSLLGTQARGTAFLTATALTTVMNFLGLKLIAFRHAASGDGQRRSLRTTGELACSTLPIASTR